MHHISSLIVDWYRNNKRDLPWRNTTDPYLIWVSEIILQQTQVQTGLLYYHRITTRYPNIVQMATATDDELMKMWQGLGYYSRARNMHQTAQHIVAQHNGQFPTTHTEIIKLKGIGPYTAAAISSFAFDLPHAVVDGNVYRFLSRHYAIDAPIDSHEGKKIFAHTAHQLLNKAHPAIHNQAIMELGSQVCKPTSPLCLECPVEVSCMAKKQNNIEQYPVKSKKTTQKIRHLNYLFVHDDQYLLISKRDKKDIWRGLYELPLFETDQPQTHQELLKNTQQYLDLNHPCATMIILSQTKHQLTHQQLHITFIEVKYDDVSKLNNMNLNHCKQISIDDIHQYAFPKPIERMINDFEMIMGNS